MGLEGQAKTTEPGQALARVSFVMPETWYDYESDPSGDELARREWARIRPCLPQDVTVLRMTSRSPCRREIDASGGRGQLRIRERSRDHARFERQPAATAPARGDDEVLRESNEEPQLLLEGPRRATRAPSAESRSTQPAAPRSEPANPSALQANAPETRQLIPVTSRKRSNPKASQSPGASPRQAKRNRPPTWLRQRLQQEGEVLAPPPPTIQ